MRYALIEEEKARFPVALMCRCLKVARSGYYAWRTRAESRRAAENRVIAEEIRAVQQQNRQRYGSPRVHAELRARGVRTGRHRVARLMRKHGLAAKRRRPYKRTTNSEHDHAVADNLLNREFSPARPNTAWVTDITYIRTDEGWLYLAAVMDLFSRRIVGWSMSERLTKDLALDALDMALRTRRPDGGLLHHSDRGCQYTSKEYRRQLRLNGVRCSMSRKGNCWDNAVIESFFGTLKGELVDRERYRTRDAARRSIFEYIETYYNLRRRHSRLEFMCPADFERAAAVTD